MANEPITVSVVIATRDRPELLRDALASVAAQSHPPLEVLIADDRDTSASPPPPAESVSRDVWAIAADPSLALLAIRVLRSGGVGVAAARNRAAREAGGVVLAFLDDDDRWHPEHLTGLAAAFIDPAVEVAFRDSVVIHERVAVDGCRVDVEARTIAHDWNAEVMGRDDFVAPSALAVRRESFVALGGFDEGFRYSEDWDFLLRAARRAAPRRVEGVTAEVRMRATGHLSQDDGAERVACLSRLAARHGLAPIAVKTFWEVAECIDSGPPGADVR
ncbi:MAG: glycosyltransferase [Candidatus Eisenbacteria bacterium]|uniref:Glycosyltransferase n=1 Tax=Eiseniibacteriota bacterium TaxID=2212470 RepID=A0A849SUN1_UNCEI|nr:glycosyltransferase [Candidatus Eisenbacteria bacterium]